MLHHYICHKHASEVEHNEPAALKLWQDFMQRGELDYALCRWDKAQAFLETAFEIAALRTNRGSNTLFCAAYLLRPFKFMFEMCISDNDFNKATNHLIQAFTLIGPHKSKATSVDLFLLQTYSLKLKDRIVESNMCESEKNRLSRICEKIYYYEEEGIQH